jgi:hypothetical protein
MAGATPAGGAGRTGTGRTGTEQATVAAVGADGSAALVTDDGVTISAPAAAVARGGWLRPRIGQRVTIVRNEHAEIVTVALPVTRRQLSPTRPAPGGDGKPATTEQCGP